MAKPETFSSRWGLIVAGLGMDQHRQALMVKHQPGDEPFERVGREGDLIHRDRMRPDGLAVPAPKHYIEAGVGRSCSRAAVSRVPSS